MSFILDALKKSENDRQRQSGPALFEVRVAPPRTRCWLWRNQRTCAPRMPLESAFTGELAGRHSMTKSPSQ